MKFKIICILMSIMLWLLSFACEPYQPLVFENKTSVPIQILIDYQGELNPSNIVWNNNAESIPPGNSKRIMTAVYNVDPESDKVKYAVLAINGNNEVVFSKIFSWEELLNQGWKVSITAINITP